MTLETQNNRFTRLAILASVVSAGVLFSLPGLAQTTFYRGRVMISPDEQMRLAAEKPASDSMGPSASSTMTPSTSTAPASMEPTASTPLPGGSQVTPGTVPPNASPSAQQVPGTSMETTTPSTSSSQSDMTGLSMGTPTPSTPGSRNDVTGTSMETTTPSTSSSQSDMTGLSMGTPTPSTPGSRNDSQMMPSQRSGSSLSATSSDSSTNTVVQAVAANGSFRTLTAALKAADLTDVLSQEGPFTIFAPTDAAFAALPPGTLAKLLKPENKAMLIKVLTYHVVSGRVSSNQLTSGAVNTVEGKSVEIQVSDGGVQVNDARVIQPDVNASNGVIHAINKVILPPDM